jgi:hypothetical protein
LAFTLNFSVAVFLSFYKLEWVKYCFYLHAFAYLVIGIVINLMLVLATPDTMLISFHLGYLINYLAVAVLFYAIAALAKYLSQTDAQSASRLDTIVIAVFIALPSFWITPLTTHFFTHTFQYLPSTESLYETIPSYIDLESPFSIWLIAWPISTFEFLSAAVISFVFSLPFLKYFDVGYAIRSALVLPTLVLMMITFHFLGHTFFDKLADTPFFDDWNFALQSLINISLGIGLGAAMTLLFRRTY